MIIPSLNDLKEMSTTIGIPATMIIGVIAAFHWGFIPSDLTDIKLDVTTLKINDEHQKKLTQKLIEQHAEQMHNLNAALKEICINTAKNDHRIYECLKIDGQLSR